MDKEMLLEKAARLESEASELRRLIEQAWKAPAQPVGDGDRVRRSLTTARASEILGIAPQTVSRLAMVNLLPHSKKGRQYRFSGRELAAAKPKIRELVSELRVRLQDRYGTEPEDVMLSVGEAQELYGLSSRIIVRLAKEGRVRSETHEVAKDSKQVCIMYVNAKDLREAVNEAKGLQVAS